MPNTTPQKTPHADKDTSPEKRGQHPADRGQATDSTRDPSGPRQGRPEQTDRDRAQVNDPTGARHRDR